jgi:hypothetical protein
MRKDEKVSKTEKNTSSFCLIPRMYFFPGYKATAAAAVLDEVSFRDPPAFLPKTTQAKTGR